MRTVSSVWSSCGPSLHLRTFMEALHGIITLSPAHVRLNWCCEYKKIYMQTLVLPQHFTIRPFCGIFREMLDTYSLFLHITVIPKKEEFKNLIIPPPHPPRFLNPTPKKSTYNNSTNFSQCGYPLNGHLCGWW